MERMKERYRRKLIKDGRDRRDGRGEVCMIVVRG